MQLKKNSLWAIFIGVLVFAQLLFVYALFIEPNWIAVNRVRIVNPQLAKPLAGVKVVQVSDLHIRGLGYREMSLVEKVNRLKPDVILITGDLLGSREGTQACWNVLDLMEPKYWIYAVTGDKDHAYAHDLIADPMWKKSGVTFIDEAAIKVNWKGEEGADLWLVGISASRTKELSDVIAGIPKAEPILVMSHLTSTAKQAAVLGLPLVIAGDTHGGQINPAFIRNFFDVEEHGKYIAGKYKLKDTILYINRGIGTSRVDIRFLCRPEITIYEFVSKGKMAGLKVLKEDSIMN